MTGNHRTSRTRSSFTRFVSRFIKTMFSDPRNHSISFPLILSQPRHNMNPYAAAGWNNPQNPHSINDGPWRPNDPNPPTYGALPPQAQLTSFRTFEFRVFSQDTLNCDVIGPKDLKFFEVRTTGGRTIVSKPNGCFARINWAPPPTLEFMAGSALASQRAREFLTLSSDTMYAKLIRVLSYVGLNFRNFLQVPDDALWGEDLRMAPTPIRGLFRELNTGRSEFPRHGLKNTPQMYTYGSNPLDKLAQICRSPDGTKVLLKLRSEAFQAGLIEPCTMATILLFSGLNIDWALDIISSLPIVDVFFRPQPDLVFPYRYYVVIGLWNIRFSQAVYLLDFFGD